MDNIKLFNDKVNKLTQQNYSVSKITELLKNDFPNLSYECIRSRVRRCVNKLPAKCSTNDNITKTQSFEYRKDGSVVFEKVICLAENEDITPETILKAHGMDASKWQIISYKNNFWQSQKKGGSILNLYQSKITAKPITDSISIEDVKKHFESFSRNFKKPSNLKVKDTANLMYEINICDLHLGRFCYDLETGEPLSSDITKKRFFEVIQEECQRLEKLDGQVEKILFVWTNDFFNSDGISKCTTGGTPQDTDKKWQDLYLTGVEMLVTAIEMLKTYAPVTTFYIASNHSRQTDFYAINYLNAWFRQDTDVQVLVDSSPRQYIVYGKNLLGFAHGYYEKKENLPFLMSNECMKDWSNTTYREFHLAHIHSERVEEKGGIIFRWLPSVTSADTWSKDCGYVMSTKRSYSFVYDKEKGLVQMNSTIVK